MFNFRFSQEVKSFLNKFKIIYWTTKKNCLKCLVLESDARKTFRLSSCTLQILLNVLSRTRVRV